MDHVSYIRNFRFYFIFIFFSAAEASNDQSIVVPFTFYDSVEGETEVIFNEEKIYILAQPILGWAEKNIHTPAQETLVNGLNSSKPGYYECPLNNQETEKYMVYYNENKHVVEVTLPLEERRVQHTSITGKKAPSLSEPDAVFLPDPFSGYLNFYFSKKFQHDSEQFFYSKQQAYLNSQSLINLNNWLLYANAYLVADNGNKAGNQIRRGQFYLTKDLVKNNMRMSLGDLSFSNIGFQNTIPTFGINLTKNPGLFNNQSIGSVGEHNFFLNAPSKVEVFVNGIYYETLEMSAGRHNIADFPLYSGLNQVELVVSDPSGKKESISLNMPYYSDILKSGESNGSIFFGFPRYASNKQGFKYVFNLPSYSINYRFGLSKETNIGWYSQGNKKQIVFGGQVLDYSSSFKTTWDFAFSYLFPSYPSFKTRLYFESLSQKEKTPLFFKLFLEYTGKNYAYFQQANADIGRIFNPYNYGIGCSLSRQFYQTRASLASYFRKHRKGGAGNQYNVSLGLSKTMLGGTFGIFGSYKRKSNKVSYFQINLSLNYSLGNNSHLSNRYDSQLKQFTSQYSRVYPLSGNRFLTTSIAGNTKGKNGKVTGNINYQGQRFNFSTAHYLANGQQFSEKNEKIHISGYTYLQASSAFLFSGKTFSISSPVTGSFALIKPENTVSYPLLIDQTYNDYKSKSDGMLPAVIKSIKNYSTSTFSISGDKDMPFNDKIELPMCGFKAENNSGFSVIVPISRMVIVEGYLYDQTNNPIKFGSGYLKNRGKNKQIFFFTNDEGKFTIHELYPGRYELTLLKPALEPITVDIKAGGASEIVSLGILKTQPLKTGLP